MTVIYERVALIGLGLIAGSMALAMRRGGLAGEIVGTARSAETRTIAQEIGLCDRIVETAAEAVDADGTVAAAAVAAAPMVAEDSVAAGPHAAPAMAAAAAAACRTSRE